MKILVAEDDELTAAAIARSLKNNHYAVNTTNNGQTAIALATTYRYDLIVLDVMLPDLDGITVCRQLRSQGCQIPILILTAKGASADRVTGLEAGADDYLVKPFDMSELLARLRALLRRGKETISEVLNWQSLQLNITTGEVTIDGVPTHLTPKEYGLLEIFMRHPGRIFSRGDLLDYVWDIDDFPGERAVNTQIMGLRHKLKQAGLDQDPIETLYGLGYRLVPPPEVHPASDESSEPVDHEVLPAIAPTEIIGSVQAVWEGFQPKLQQQIALMEKATKQLRHNTLEPALRKQVQTIAHRLVGSLGTFGSARGSHIARHIEHLLQQEVYSPDLAAEELDSLLSDLQQAIAHMQDATDPELTSPEPSSTVDGWIEDSAALASDPCILVIDNDLDLTAQIQAAAPRWQCQVKTANTLEDVHQAIATQPPDGILLDLTFPHPTGDAGLLLLEELSQQCPTTPIIVMTDRNQFSDRIAVARLGGRAFLQKPVSIDLLYRIISQTVNPVSQRSITVMVVDDDAVSLALIAAVLEPRNIEVCALDDPTQFWDMLELTLPDVLILDVEMEGANGLELCKMVRQDPYWNRLPILFLSAHTDPDTVRRIYATGADDFVGKPLVEEELLTRLLNRLERMDSRPRRIG